MDGELLRLSQFDHMFRPDIQTKMFFGGWLVYISYA